MIMFLFTDTLNTNKIGFEVNKLSISFTNGNYSTFTKFSSEDINWKNNNKSYLKNVFRGYFHSKHVLVI